MRIPHLFNFSGANIKRKGYYFNLIEISYPEKKAPFILTKMSKTDKAEIVHSNQKIGYQFAL